MSYFITEKEVEKYLERKTRRLPMPDGTTYPVTAFNLTWDALEFVLASKFWTEEELVEMCLFDAKEKEISLEEYFPSAIDYMQRRIENGGDCPD